jgi:citrate lyase beta subunit
MGRDGRSPLPRLIDAGGPRLFAAVFGAYDFTAGLGITAAHQGMRHPSCDFARNMMLVAFADSHVRVSDGATAVLPISTNAAEVHAAWRINYDNVRHSLESGLYQGWDLHPAQLVSRYAATFAFFMEGLEAASARLKNFVAKSAQATRVGTAFDDAATGRGLVNYFLRAVASGAITESEAVAKTGMSSEELRKLSF